MSPIPLGILASIGGAGGEFFFSLYGNAGDQRVSHIKTRGEKIYVAGLEISNKSLLAVFDTTPARIFDQIIANGEAKSVAIDTSENSYLLGSPTFTFTKTNSTGTVQFQRTLSNFNDAASNIFTDVSDNVYLLGYSQNTGSYHHQIVKTDSSGNVAFQRRIGAPSTFALWGAGNQATQVHFVGDTQFGMYKIDGQMSHIWSRRLSAGIGTSIAVDQSDSSVYGTGLDGGFGILLKRNSSGTLLWQRRFEALGGSIVGRPFAAAVDTSGNVYVQARLGSGNTLLLAKLDSSGNTIWQREVVFSGSFSSLSASGAENISIDSLGRLVFGITVSRPSARSDIFVARVPNDGSLTQTITIDGVSMEYRASSSFTISPSSYTNTDLGNTLAFSALNVSTPSLTITTPNLPLETDYL